MREGAEPPEPLFFDKSDGSPRASASASTKRSKLSTKTIRGTKPGYKCTPIPLELSLSASVANTTSLTSSSSPPSPSSPSADDPPPSIRSSHLHVSDQAKFAVPMCQPSFSTAEKAKTEPKMQTHPLPSESSLISRQIATKRRLRQQIRGTTPGKQSTSNSQSNDSIFARLCKPAAGDAEYVSDTSNASSIDITATSNEVPILGSLPSTGSETTASCKTGAFASGDQNGSFGGPKNADNHRCGSNPSYERPTSARLSSTAERISSHVHINGMTFQDYKQYISARFGTGRLITASDRSGRAKARVKTLDTSALAVSSPPAAGTSRSNIQRRKSAPGLTSPVQHRSGYSRKQDTPAEPASIVQGKDQCDYSSTAGKRSGTANSNAYLQPETGITDASKRFANQQRQVEKEQPRPTCGHHNQSYPQKRSNSVPEVVVASSKPHVYRRPQPPKQPAPCSTSCISDGPVSGNRSLGAGSRVGNSVIPTDFSSRHF